MKEITDAEYNHKKRFWEDIGKHVNITFKQIRYYQLTYLKLSKQMFWNLGNLYGHFLFSTIINLANSYNKDKIKIKYID